MSSKAQHSAGSNKKERNLTAYYQFLAFKREELRQNGRLKLPTKEVMAHWKALSEQERREWEDKATEAQQKYLKECMERAAAACDGEDEVEGKREAQGDADGDMDCENSEDGHVNDDDDMQTLTLPLARVTRIVRCNKDIGKIGRDACFLVVKATEHFLERCVTEALRATARRNAKTIMLRDILTSMRERPDRESVQIFLDEFQPLKEMNPPSKKSSSGKKRPASSKGTTAAAAVEEARQPEERPTKSSKNKTS
eukprot:CAMPEP_0119326412 /NCGR_PEP_ID=MMETSP1333-20130426/68333_1 /TAXON_ID=418940 /ORGANISM="Scyphosphaera apsteinii, Strain RCC1455" /LENGTH=253 /DNA_ID=CAMNT_0007334719 /DNA_START=95 /DNA_END=856 /DNA_ORIENTATION=+